MQLFRFQLIIMLSIGLSVFGQTLPQPESFKPNVIIGTNNNNPVYSQPQNQSNGLDVYEQDKKELQQRDAELYKQLYRESEFQAISYELPSLLNEKGTEYYQQAFHKLNNMLKGKQPMSIKQAVFITENAFFENKLDYKKYDSEIKSIAHIAQLKAMQDGESWKNSQTRNIMLFKALSDTIKVKDNSHEGFITSYPMQYDFSDFYGKGDWSKMFVTKLLASKSGQCHSMPLLFMILAEETKTKAYLSFAPSHSYVKYKDKSNNWHNLELTNGCEVSEAWVLGSGFIKSEALKSKIYMDTVNTKQTIAYCLTDLAKGYIRKYGYDDFVKQCVDSALKYYPNNIYALQIKSDYYTLLFDHVIKQTNRPRPEILQKQYPKAFEILLQRNKLYETIDKSGYTEMPEEAYKDWLKSVNAEKEKQEQQGQKLHLTRSIK